MKRLVFVMAMVAGVMMGCGGGGGGGGDAVSSKPAVSDSIEGHYVLKKFVVKWKNGGYFTTDMVDKSRWSGKMSIYSNMYVVQRVTLDGRTVYAEGWIVEVKKGVKRIIVEDNGCRYPVDYWWRSPTLTTQVNYPCRTDWRETDTWEKISDTPQPVNNALTTADPTKEIEEATENGEMGAFGGLIQELW